MCSCWFLFNFSQNLASEPIIMRTPTQTDLATLSMDAIRSIIKKNPLSEEQAQNLITKEENGRARKLVISLLAREAHAAKRRRNLKQIHEEGIRLPTVRNGL